ncbi:MAG: type II secretion system protein GspL [Gammaproteobacteria bacterium]|nr:type II secretion system protein GspL [Gammaproteobacteria bacterium]
MLCRINFHDHDLQSFDWVKLDDSGSGVIDAGSSDADQLRRVCGNSSSVQVFLPQQDIHLTSAQLPPKASKQQLNAIAFAIEDHLADDIDNCFCAISNQQEDGRVPVAVIERDIMDDCMQLLADQNINAREILAPVYLCPWSDAADFLSSVCEFNGGYLLRHGEHAGFYCDAAILPQLLKLLQKQKPGASRVDFYAEAVTDEVLGLELEVYQHPPRDLLAASLDQPQRINFKQKEYQSAHIWVESMKRWKWPLLVGSMLLLVFLSTTGIGLWNKTRVHDELIAQQQALLKRHLPQLEPGSRPKQQMIRHLTASQQTQGETRFLDMLYEYADLISSFPDIKTSRLQYQQATLSASLESKNLKSLESLRNRIAESKFDAQIENVNISPQQTTGRLVLKEAR